MSFVTFDSEEKIWSGVRNQTIFNPEVSVGYLILSEFKKTPERITQVSADTGVEVTCHEMRQRSIKMAKHLQSLGLRQGDVVGFMANNTEFLAPIVFACLTLGLPINALATSKPESDVLHLFSKTKPRIIFCDSDATTTVQNAVNKFEGIKPMIYTLVEKVEDYTFVEDVLSDNCTADGFVFPELNDIANSTAVILWSSATTGPEKGICKTHSQIIHQSYPAWDANIEEQEVILAFATIAWGTGISFLIFGSLHGAKRVITAKGLETALMVDIFHRYRVTTALSLPFAIREIVKTPNIEPFQSLRVLVSTGLGLTGSLQKQFEPFIPNGKVVVVYASSEGGYIAETSKAQRYGSCGFPAPNVQIKVIDHQESHLGPNEIGEIHYTSQSLFSGYLDDPEKTAETLVDGWVVSGDMGLVDEDGFVFLVDRKVDMLKYNDSLVSPSELEKLIEQIDGVKDVCVVGVPDESSNDIIFAFVEKEDSASSLSAAKIENLVNGKVIDAKKLRGGVHFVDRIPLSSIGKKLRKEVKKLAAEIHRSRLDVSISKSQLADQMSEASCLKQLS